MLLKDFIILLSPHPYLICMNMPGIDVFVLCSAVLSCSVNVNISTKMHRDNENTRSECNRMLQHNIIHTVILMDISQCDTPAPVL
jgi:hypothetical protein